MIPAPLTGGGTQRRVGASSRAPTEMKTRLPRVGPQGQMTGGQHCREGGPGQALPFLSRSCSCISTCQHGCSSLCCLSGIFPLFRRLSQEQTWTHRAGGPWGLAGRDAPGCPHPPPLLRAWPAPVPARLGAQLVTPGQTPDSGSSKGPLFRTVGGHLGAGLLGSELQVMWVWKPNINEQLGGVGRGERERDLTGRQAERLR